MVSKDIATFFISGKTMFVEVLSRNTVTGYATQSPHGSFDISNSQDAVPVDISNDEEIVRKMAETVGSAIDIDPNSVSSDNGLSAESTGSGGVSSQTCKVKMTNRSELASSESTGFEVAESSSSSQLHVSDGDINSDGDETPPGSNARGTAEQSRVWLLRLGHFLNPGSI